MVHLADTHDELFTTVTKAADELLGFEYNTVRRHDTNPDRLVPVTVSPTLREQSNRRVSDRDTSIQWNAVEHAGADVTVRVGALSDGFYVEDDGVGIPESERDVVLAAGEAAQPHWTGFGLRVVAEIADAHGWSVVVTERDGGGARFEFREVDCTTEPAAVAPGERSSPGES